MAFPQLTPVSSGVQGWDATISDNFAIVTTGPFPLHRSAALTEANLAATHPAASFDKCFVWVNHTVFGYTLYWSDGTNWQPFGFEKRTTALVTGAATLNGREDLVLLAGTPPYTVTLAPAANWAGKTVTLKLTVAGGIVTLDGNGSETIDGALTSVVLAAQWDSVTLYSTGTSILILR